MRLHLKWNGFPIRSSGRLTKNSFSDSTEIPYPPRVLSLHHDGDRGGDLSMESMGHFPVLCGGNVKSDGNESGNALESSQWVHRLHSQLRDGRGRGGGDYVEIGGSGGVQRKITK